MRRKEAKVENERREEKPRYRSGLSQINKYGGLTEGLRRHGDGYIVVV